LALGVAAAAGMACGPDPIELPEPPLAAETAAIAAEYAAPSGTLDGAALRQTAADVRARVEELDMPWLPRLLSSLLTRLQRRFDSAGLPQDPTAPRDTDRAVIKAVIDLDFVCPGWADPPGPPNSDENGKLRVTALVIDARLQPTIWGTASGCRARIEPLGNTPLVPATLEATVPDAGAPPAAPTDAAPAASPPALDAFLDGSLLLYLYGPLPESNLDADFLMRFTAQIGIGERTRKLDVDLRWIDRQLEFRHPVADGNIIVGIGLTRFTLRGRNLSVTCDATTLSCE
jgi:hypothetical protein